MIRTGLAYFDYVEKRMKELDGRAKLFLRDKGIRDEGGIMDPKDDKHDDGRPPNKRYRIDPSSAHQRRCDDAPVICYNLFCRSPMECTCKPAFHKIP
ncbi:hypothetical protein KIN20_011324 [Parelaphostrongylus tenuis]|uniref:Uncharacterized protein n=1 Tax=Parelaphostrongylus tenuis TaxID=148309 RepID=A0AAD5MRY3_PARTN|nr:hypothetical protein KIN20_011324 [Parelaphostrongylus tenuis]